MCEVVQRGHGKEVSDFKKGQIIYLHQSKKTTKEIAEITGIGLRNVQRIIKTWKDSGELPSSRNKCGRKKTLKFSGPKTSEATGEEKSQKNPTLEVMTLFKTGHGAYQPAQCEENLKKWN
ncbi:hypothetical protein AVEN_191986-1 [Araneus ventricosus]|uniref:Uncharacterized protein n=1 Tax=Araneus ventricosus TaxID=182803 RepID=A0A4Y2SLV8_ARAVE|nr:hypothetical protein AVEN_191986-1 [Araneus ventricosus]